MNATQATDGTRKRKTKQKPIQKATTIKVAGASLARITQAAYAARAKNKGQFVEALLELWNTADDDARKRAMDRVWGEAK